MKYDIPIEDTTIKNRFEIRLKNGRTLSALIVGVWNCDQTRALYAYKDAELDKQAGGFHLESLREDWQ